MKVFIDGSAGTTGLQIYERLSARRDLELITIDEAERKDVNARLRCIEKADVVFLCLPDAAASEIAALADPSVCLIDTSTAHRTAPDWVYGFPELGLKEKIAASKRIANPGCHATGFISGLYPLVKQGLVKTDAPLTCFSLTGYSGGGKKMIAAYEAEDRSEALASPRIYALGQKHKHLPEIQCLCGLTEAPLFCPIVSDYYKGMATTVPLAASSLNGCTLADVRTALADFYAGQPLIRVFSADETAALGTIYAGSKAGRDSLDLIVAGNDERLTVTALFDNLGKGASGAAIENMNLVMGLDPATGLIV